MAVETVAGTEISISAGTPATFDGTGYAALTFSKIGEITDGGNHGRTYAEVKNSPIGTRGVQKYKGSFDEGNKTLQMAIDDDDVGQVFLKTALHSDGDYSFKVKYQGGAIDYFRAKVMKFEKATAGVDSMRTASVELSLSTNSAGIGIIEVAAP